MPRTGKKPRIQGVAEENLDPHAELNLRARNILQSLGNANDIIKQNKVKAPQPAPVKDRQKLTKGDQIPEDSPNAVLLRDMFDHCKHLALGGTESLIASTTSPTVLFKLYAATKQLHQAIGERIAELRPDIKAKADGAITFHPIPKWRADGKGYYLTVELVWKENGKRTTETIDVSDFLEASPQPSGKSHAVSVRGGRKQSKDERDL